jgi:hypothetical protein
MAREQAKQGIIERGAAFFEKLHYGLGAAAIAGALIAPEAIAAPLIVFGAYEIAHGALWNWIKNRSSKKPDLVPAAT